MTPSTSFRVSGGGDAYLSRESNEVLQKAEAISQRMQDQYVALEHLLKHRRSRK